MKIRGGRFVIQEGFANIPAKIWRDSLPPRVPTALGCNALERDETVYLFDSLSLKLLRYIFLYLLPSQQQTLTLTTKISSN